VSKNYIIVELLDGSRLKLPAWMASAEAAIFVVSDCPTVSLDALMVVSELIEIRHENEIAEYEQIGFTLPRRRSTPKKGKQDETTSALEHEKETQSNRDGEGRPPRGSRNYGRGNNRRCSVRKGEKR
jgi:hypothetical protein